MEPIPLISYSDLVVILLTALAVMLAILAIIIAVLAVFGYAGFKEAVRDAVQRCVGPIMDQKLKEYPEAAKYVELFSAVQARLDALDAIQDTIVSKPVPEPTQAASNVPANETEVERGEAHRPIESYPGEEPQNVSNATTAAPAANPATDSRPDHTEPSKGSSR